MKNIITYTGKATYLGIQRFDSNGISIAQEKLILIAGYGIKHDSHAGATHIVDEREKLLIKYGIPKEVAMANLRQITIVTKQELETIAARMDLPVSMIPYGLLGENIVLDIDEHHNLTTEAKAGSIITFKNGNTSRLASIYITGENHPCHIPAQNIFARLNIKGRIKDFTDKAEGVRGLTGVVLTGGKIKLRDQAIICLA
jgi:hypothetical protein